MSDTLTKRRFPSRDIVEVHVEIIARHTAKIHDISLGNGSAVRQQRITDLQVLKVATEGMYIRLSHGSAAHVLASHGCQHRW